MSNQESHLPVFQRHSVRSNVRNGYGNVSRPTVNQGQGGISARTIRSQSVSNDTEERRDRHNRLSNLVQSLWEEGVTVNVLSLWKEAGLPFSVPLGTVNQDIYSGNVPSLTEYHEPIRSQQEMPPPIVDSGYCPVSPAELSSPERVPSDTVTYEPGEHSGNVPSLAENQEPIRSQQETPPPVVDSEGYTPVSPGYCPDSPAFSSPRRVPSYTVTYEPEGYTPVSPRYCPVFPAFSSPRRVPSYTVTYEPEGYTPVSPGYCPVSFAELSSPRRVPSDTVIYEPGYTPEPEFMAELFDAPDFGGTGGLHTPVSPNEQSEHIRVSLEGSSQPVAQNGEDATMPPPPPKEPTFTCPVCFSPLADAMSTKCGHIFCKICLRGSLAVQRKCPACRREISIRDCIKVYLPAISN